MTNGEKIKAILKPRTDQIKIYSDWLEIEIQSLGINFSCELKWWDKEYKESDRSSRDDDCPLVEIVTCKDCKHNYEDTCDIDGLGVCDDYFCANGKRKEEEEE